LATAFLRQGSGGAKESQSSRRRRPKPPKIPESGSRAATLGGMPAGRRNTGGPAWTGTARLGPPSDTGSPTAPRSHRLRMKASLGWSTRGARPLRSSYLRPRPQGIVTVRPHCGTAQIKVWFRSRARLGKNGPLGSSFHRALVRARLAARRRPRSTSLRAVTTFRSWAAGTKRTRH
jgi:hypothetical protein